MSKNRTEEEVLQETRKKYPRVFPDGYVFYEICREARNSIKRNRQELEKLNKEYEEPYADRAGLFVEMQGCIEKLNKAEVVAITFAAMCLEAYIWDYAACNKSQNYTKDYLEKLDFVAKWVVIPELICGSRIENPSLLSLLGKLRKARNNIVHSKSKPTPNNLDEFRKALNKKREIKGEDAFNVIRLLLEELDKIDNSNWWFFQTPYYRYSIKKTSKGGRLA